jgi:UDP-glucose 4-epimerase
MKILVTGGAGFIGSHLVDRLIKENHRVVIVDNLSTGKKEFINSKAKFYKLDIKSPKIKAVFQKEKPNFVFHLAAQKSVLFSLRNPIIDAQINIVGSLNIIENSISTGVKKFIFTSTGGAIYGQTKLIPSLETTPETPNSPYGLAKLTIDYYLNNYFSKVKKLNFVSLRLANVYGPRQDPLGEAGVIAVFVSNLLKNQPCYIYGSGKQTRDFVYVDDVISACLK